MCVSLSIPVRVPATVRAVLAFLYCKGGKKENTVLGDQIMLICKVICQAIPVWGTMILSS